MYYIFIIFWNLIVKSFCVVGFFYIDGYCYKIYYRVCFNWMDVLKNCLRGGYCLVMVNISV